MSRCKQVVEGLPEHNFTVLKFLLGFLHTVGPGPVLGRDDISLSP